MPATSASRTFRIPLPVHLFDNSNAHIFLMVCMRLPSSTCTDTRRLRQLIHATSHCASHATSTSSCKVTVAVASAVGLRGSAPVAGLVVFTGVQRFQTGFVVNFGRIQGLYSSGGFGYPEAFL